MAGSQNDASRRGGVKAFTLPELLVVMAVMAVLASGLLAALGNAKNTARRTTCLNNLKQINLGVRMYSDDFKDTSPDLGPGQRIWFLYRQQMQSYVGLNGPSSSNDTLFACPADTFSYVLNLSPPGFSYVRTGCHQQAHFNFTSYALNAANSGTNKNPATLFGVSGHKLSSIKHPARTALVLENPAFIPYSWHQPKHPSPPAPWGSDSVFPTFNDAMNMVSFVDGHVSYTKIYWNSTPNKDGYYELAYFYNPPVEYDYQWSGD